jgi:hypothetical protein
MLLLHETLTSIRLRDFNKLQCLKNTVCSTVTKMFSCFSVSLLLAPGASSKSIIDYDTNICRLHTREIATKMHCFKINAYSGTESCPSVLQRVGICVPARNIRNFSCSVALPVTVLQLHVLLLLI